MRILYLEPFEGGSHAAFTRALIDGVSAEWTALTLPARHWKWRVRGSAAFFALAQPDRLRGPFDLLFASSYLPLTDLLALAPALAPVPSILYFHENQLAFPTTPHTDAVRDLHFGFTQLTSALAATRCVFNSEWNRASFLDEGGRLLRRMPDCRPPGWIDAVAAKSEVLPLPLSLPDRAPDRLGGGPGASDDERALGPIVLWNHRWEHDKDPATFFEVMIRLRQAGTPFRLAVCGQRFDRAPACFQAARQALADRIVHWGWLERRADYERLLGRAHLAVSTAAHEFFGVSMLEAAHFGCRPLVPDALAYPERFPAEHRYPPGGLAEPLDRLCRAWVAGASLRADRRDLTRPLGAPLLARYRALFERLARTGR